MDLEAQHQHLLAQHQDYQHEQQPQQYQYEQQPQQAAQPYDPSQPQAYEYDPSTQAYYPGYPQPYQNSTSLPQQQYPPQQQPYPYYPPDYGTAAPAAASYQQQPSQTDPNNGQSSAINFPTEAPQVAGAQPQQNAYYPQDQQPSYDVPSGLNPAAAAAVAALSQLTQFAGKMDAAERAMAGMQERQWQANNEAFGQMVGQPPVPHGHVNFRPPVGRPPYRGGGGRRGGGRFGGGHFGGGRFRGDRSNFGPRRPRPDGGAPPFRGRGRMGRGGGRRFPQPAPAASSHYSESAPNLEPAAALLAPAPERKRRPPQVAWCDLCRVDCNTQEVLEQHMNGKRHKKNLEKLEQFQKYEKLSSDPQSKLTEQLENSQGGEEIKVSAPENLPDASAPENLPDASAPENLPAASSPENLPSASAADENKVEMEQQTQTGEQSEISKMEEPIEAPARKPWAGSFEDRRRGFKRKPMKFSRGGKRPRYSEVVSNSVTPKEEPKHCALCNVTCDTQAVLECHLAGKKHMSRVKQTPGHHGSYGPKGLRAVYTPHAQPRGFFPQGHNQPPIHGEGQDAADMHQGLPVVDHGDAQAQQVGTEPQAQQDSGLQGQNSTAEPMVPEVVMVEAKDQGAVTVEIEGKVTALENASTGAKPDLLVMKDASAPDYGVSTTDHVVLPGLDIKVDEGYKSAEQASQSLVDSL